MSKKKEKEGVERIRELANTEIPVLVVFVKKTKGDNTVMVGAAHCLENSGASPEQVVWTLEKIKHDWLTFDQLYREKQNKPDEKEDA